MVFKAGAHPIIYASLNLRQGAAVFEVRVLEQVILSYLKPNLNSSKSIFFLFSKGRREPFFYIFILWNPTYTHLNLNQVGLATQQKYLMLLMAILIILILIKI